MITKDLTKVQLYEQISALQDKINSLEKKLEAHRHTEDALRTSEKNLSAILEKNADGIIIVNFDGTVLYVNPAAEKIFGRSKKNLLGYPFGFPVSANKEEDYLVVKKGVTFCYDVELRVVQVHWQKQPAYQLSVRDITKLKQAEEELKKSEEKFKAIIENSADAIFITDINGKYIYTNKAVTELLGFSPEEMKSKTIIDMAPANKINEHLEIFKSLQRKGKLFTEIELLQKDGSFISTDLHSVILPGGLVYGSCRDITERKKVEEALKASEIRYRMMFETAKDGILILNADNGIIIDANPLMIEMLGCTGKEIIGKKFSEIGLFSNKHTKEASLNKLKEQIYNRYEDLTLAVKNQKTIYVDFISNVYNINNKKIIHCNIRDVTDRKQALDEIRKYHERLEELVDERTKKLKKSETRLQKAIKTAENANKAKSQFLANMSHEIRTPMNSIIGFSDILFASVKDKKQRSQVDSIRSSSRDLLKIINDILDLSKIEAGKLNIEHNLVNPDNLISDISNMFAQSLEKKGISFNTGTASSLPKSFFMDEVRLRQILLNLLSNAIKFTEKGFITLTLDSVLKKNNRFDLIIKVEDSGIGIPKEQQQTIFEAFNQIEGQSTKKYGGTGLGLAIVKKLVEMMGGEINLESEVGKGSIFEVILYEIEIADIDEISKEEKNIDPKSIIFDKAKILIADDRQSNRKLIIDLLENSPLIIYEAENGKEALDIVEKKSPDLIIMDLKMPEMNGFEATKILKNQESTKLIPVIAITASVKNLVNNKKTPDIFDEYLIKPINIFDLLRLLKKYLKYIENKVFTETEGLIELDLEMNEEQKIHIPEILYVLKKDFLPSYYELMKIHSMEQIEDFGKDLVSLGEKYTFKLIIQFGKDIVSYADNFDIEKLLAKLNVFPALIEKINAMKQ